jgi:glyoxylase-like metal-dependent hydrolase (beta-lactamase superfamily II)
MNSATRLTLLLAALVIAPSPGAAFQVDPAAPAIAPYESRELASGVHMLATPLAYRGGVTGNITIIEQSDGMVVIDSGGTAADGRRAVAFIRSITRKPVKALVYTHWHGDHPQGGSEIRAAWPRTRIISTVGTREALRTAALRYIGLRPDERFETINLNQVSGLITQWDAMANNPANDEETRTRYRTAVAQVRARRLDWRGTHLAMPNVTFSGELLLDDRERPVRLMYLGRANTDGDAIAWLPNQRIVVTGDVVVHPIPFGFYSFPGDWITVLERIKALDYRILVPGHGEPQTDTVYIDRVGATLSDLRAQIGPLARQGLSLEQVRARVNFDPTREIFGDTPRNRLLIDAFWLTPMTVNTYMEARGTPMVQGDESIYPNN